MSKVVAPGLRLGYVAAPKDLIERLVAYRSFADLQGDPVLECAIAELFEDGLIQRHIRRMRRLYRERLTTLTSALRSQLGDFVSFRAPSGGTAIWVRTRDAQMMARRAGQCRACSPRCP
jgi:GntR family transcriptional regulator / MocR family aminotransferase